ncbi:MAG: hypothetical protein KC635_14595 [Myxococcales bacterium]|nr:hypothetical protein [Myxococcales bacterium]MCB9737042.1 hypothetical protein [Deltaproteobacteria bacterium]
MSAPSPNDAPAPTPPPADLDAPFTGLRQLLASERGGFKPMVLLWALGVPLPIVLIIALVRGC